MLCAGVLEGLEANPGGLERGLVGRPGGVDALVGIGKDHQHLGLDARDLVDGRRAAVKGHPGQQLGHARGQHVDDAAAKAEAHRAQAAVAACDAARLGRCSDKVLAGLAGVELAKQLARLVLVARVAAQREQRVRRHGDELLQRQAARNVLDVRVEAAVLVHHQHHRQRTGGLRRAGDVGTHTAVARR